MKTSAPQPHTEAAWHEALVGWMAEHLDRQGRWLQTLHTDDANIADIASADTHANYRAWSTSNDWEAPFLARSVPECLRVVFGCETPAIKAVLALCACQVDGTLRRVATGLSDGVFSLSAAMRCVGEAADWSAVEPLQRWGFLDQTDPPMVAPDVLHWLLGGNPGHNLRRIPRVTPLRNWPVDEATARVRANLERGTPVRLVVRGATSSGRRSFANLVSSAIGLPLAEPETSADLAFLRACLASSCAPLFDANRPSIQPPFPPPVCVVVTSTDAPLPAQPHPRCVDIEVALHAPPSSDLVELWAKALASAEATYHDDDLERLVNRRATRLGDIAAIGRRRIANVAEAETILNERQRARFDELAHRIDTRFRREDLIVDDPTSVALERVVHEARFKRRLFSTAEVERFFGGRRGVVTLFHGPSGCGKTMAAQVVASELGVELFRVDVSAIVSKWVGETMKNLKHVLLQANDTNAVVFFDEADSLFSQRSDGTEAQDQHVNTDTTFLLQALEDFDGVAVLASNRRHHLDTAFARRFRHVIEFRPPTTEVRRAMWTQFLDSLGLDSPDVRAALDRLARLELTGAEIKGALLSAVLEFANPMVIGLSALIDGIDHELGKSSSGLSQRQRDELRGRQ